MIYHECPVVGEIYPYSLSDADAHQPDTESARDKTGCDLPTIALLQASKTVRNEAEPMLYQRNVLTSRSATFTKKFFEHCLNTPERQMWLKSGCMWLDFEDITQTNREAVLSKQLGLAQDRLLFLERNVYQTSFEQVDWRNYRSTSRWLDAEVCAATWALVLYWHSARGFVMGMSKRFQMMGLEEE